MDRDASLPGGDGVPAQLGPADSGPTELGSAEWGETCRRAILQTARMWEQYGVTTLRRSTAEDSRMPRKPTAAKSSSSSSPARSTQATPAQAVPAKVTPAKVAPAKGTPVAAHPPAGGAAAGESPPPVKLPVLSLAARRDALHQLNLRVQACTACAELASTRQQTVFGVGNPRARICFLGEAPGADEDQQGEPFVGRAGQLLTKIIEACGWQRDDVYILNILKCRPPGNRNPAPDEVQHCRPFFERQLEIIQPEFICCLGAVAASNLLQSTLPIGRLRGSFHPWRNSRVMATYHPAYLLRNPPAKRDVWEDMKMLLKEMGLPIPRGNPA